ncbi:MAG: hypothetical protein IJN81_12175 [Clostridia bacterium]|nr:hypothetical protein [Clostridia bacterium]
MTVWYVITKIFTFPGALTKAFYEQLMCKIFKCPVEDNRYLRTDEMCGHVEHEFIERPVASFMYCFIPGLLNFFFAMFLGLFPLVNVLYLGNYSGFVASSQILSSAITDANAVALVDMLLPIIFMWLCVSMLNNLFPLIEDAVVMKEQYSKLNGFAKVIFFPGYIVMSIGARLEKYGISFIILAVLSFVLAIV